MLFFLKSSVFNRIWNHLIDISKMSQTTIIITTHYIEEARKADRVGLMRGGKILAENSPEYLLNYYGTDVISISFFFLQIFTQ
jgi:ABC-type multidrug transport system ATPase subunit